MESVIAELTISAENAENNAPIQRDEGRLAQAALSYKVAARCRSAIDAIRNLPHTFTATSLTQG
jgi:hypothetical protein